jgi:hypothetical protein
MDFVVIFHFIFKLCLYIIVIWGAFLVILLFVIWLKLLSLLNKLCEIVEDLNEKYFIMEYFVSLPFKFLVRVFKKIKK